MSDIFNMADTWNAGGTTFTAIKMNVTDTASASASLLLDLQVGGSSQVSVRKDGYLQANYLALKSGSTPTLYFQSTTTGALAFFNGAGAAPTSLGFGTDLFLVRDAADTLALRNSNNNQTMRFGGANAAYCQISTLNESHTLAAAATSDTTIQFPANSIGLGVTIRVTTLITGCASLDVGIAGATTRYGTGIALTAGTTNVSPGATNPSIYASATSVRFTAVGGGASFTAGVIRTTLHYISLSAPTS